MDTDIDDKQFSCLVVPKNGEVCLWIYVQPRASKTGFIGLHDGCLKLAVNAPPVDNKANRAVASYLADYFNIARYRVRLESGEKSRRKLFCLNGIGVSEIQDRLRPLFQHE
jgi:hypothetical protein